MVKAVLKMSIELHPWMFSRLSRKQSGNEKQPPKRPRGGNDNRRKRTGERGLLRRRPRRPGRRLRPG